LVASGFDAADMDPLARMSCDGKKYVTSWTVASRTDYWLFLPVNLIIVSIVHVAVVAFFAMVGIVFDFVNLI
jgi:hypothetical protein